jgi:hypothetical protein
MAAGELCLTGAADAIDIKDEALTAETLQSGIANGLCNSRDANFF